METQYGFTDYTFEQVLVRARAAEAADLAAASVRKTPEFSDIHDLLRKQGLDNLAKALGGGGRGSGLGARE